MRSESTLAMYPGTRYQQKQMSHHETQETIALPVTRLIPVQVQQSHIYFIYTVFNLYIANTFPL